MIDDVISHFTYAGLFVVLFAGGVGLPVPEEAVIVTAGILAHEKVILWWPAILVCLAGVLTGDCVLYWAGHHWRERILGWKVVRHVLSEEQEHRLQAGYQRHGAKIIFTARHLFGLRVAAFLTAGIVGVPFWKFFLVDALAAALSVPLAFGLAYLFTDRVIALMTDIHRAEHWGFLIALVALAIWLGYRAWRGSRRIA